MKLNLSKVEFLTLVLVFALSNTYAQVIELEDNQVIEFQTKQLSNSDQAKEIGEDWDQDSMHMIYSNLDFKLRLFEHKFNVSWFFRHSQSGLYKDDRLAQNYAIYPSKIVARDLFKTHYLKETDQSRTESIINKFTYEFGDEDFHFRLGRMYIDYGEGFIANPINPFNLPGFSGSHAKFNQGNDGLSIKIQKNDRLKLQFYLLQDRSYRNYQDEKLTRTFMLQGDWKYKKDTDILYILGEDQKRHKYGLQVKKNFEKGMLFIQGVRFSQKLDKQEAYEKGLFHYLLGVQYEFINHLNTRLEIGKQQFSENLDEANHISTTFIPLQKIIALVNDYQHNDKHRTSLIYAQDADTEFSFYKIEHNFAANKRHDVFLYHMSPISDSDAEDSLYTLQRTLAAETTFGIRLFY